jgi:glycosyltransferase involved in cell wall biosynthesis
MRILYISDNFPPEVNAPASRTYEHCREWVRCGAEVSVITCAPNFPRGKVFPGYRNRLYQVEWMDGIRVVRIWSFITANEGFLKRTLDYISFGAMAFLAGLFQRADIVVATSPQFFAAAGGYLLAAARRKPWIMEVRDLWPESIAAVNAMKNHRLLRWLERLELFLYRKATKVVVVTDAFRENIARRGIPAEKIEVVKNGVRLAQFHPRPADQELLDTLGLRGQTVVGYYGTHGLAHKLDFILECAAEAPPNITFLFIGDGAERDKLAAMRERMGLRNAIFLPSVSKEAISSYISIIDVALVPLRRSDTFKTVIPSKIFENAAMEKPILLGVEGESKALIESYGAGLCFEPENKADFLARLGRLVDDAELYARCQEGCQALARDFNREALAENMLAIVAAVAGMPVPMKSKDLPPPRRTTSSVKS